MIQQNKMMHFLSLEIRVTPVLHYMFDAGYPIDTKKAMNIYKDWRESLSGINRQMRNVHEASRYDDKRAAKGSDSSWPELAHLRNKIEDKIRRFPAEVLKCSKDEAVIYCSYRSIGTDTFQKKYKLK